MKIKIKYFDGATKLQRISKGNWIDVYANKEVFIKENESAMIPLGFALELPLGWEGHLLPRSSTFKTWGVIETNSQGVIDTSYSGDNDQWHMPLYCLEAREEKTEFINCYEGGDVEITVRGTTIKKGDKIGQFRIMQVMPAFEFEEVKTLGNKDRGGFGSTGRR